MTAAATPTFAILKFQTISQLHQYIACAEQAAGIRFAKDKVSNGSARCRLIHMITDGPSPRPYLRYQRHPLGPHMYMQGSGCPATETVR